MRWGAVIALMLIAGMARARVHDIRMVPRYGDARLGQIKQLDDLIFAGGRWIEIRLPDYAEYDGLTVTMWLKRTNYTQWEIYPCTMYCPIEIDRTRPDLLEGAGVGLDLSAAGGSVGFSGVGFMANPRTAHERHYPNGVATIAGTSEQQITVSVGGNDTLVSGVFNVNQVVGDGGDTVVISGGGKCDVRVSNTPQYEFYGNGGITGVSGKSVPQFAITNTYRFVVWRVEGGTSRVDVGCDLPGIWSEGSYEDSGDYSGKLSGKGMYRMSVFSLVPGQIYDLSMFDARVFGRRLTDAELERIQINGVLELERRGWL